VFKIVIFMKGIHRVLLCTCAWIIIYIAVHCCITHTRINQELGVILQCPPHHMWIGCGAHPASCEMGAKVKVLWCLGTLPLGPTQPVTIWYWC
jgi:hypothetical protein